MATPEAGTTGSPVGPSNPQQQQQNGSSNVSGGPAGGNTSSGWAAAQKVLVGVQVAGEFKTLRDHLGGDSTYIRSGSLETMRVLGEGSFGTVSLAWLRIEGRQDREVAVKALKKDLVSDPKEIAVFANEARLLRKLRHKHIVEFLGCGAGVIPGDSSHGARLRQQQEQEQEEELFYVTEYLKGGSLQDLLMRQMADPFARVYSDADALRWTTQVTMALAYLHSRRPLVMHRDIKLENIMLDGLDLQTARAKLTDFGLARLVSLRPVRSSVAAKLGQLLSQPRENWKPALRLRSDSVGPEVLNRWLSSTGSQELELSSKAGAAAAAAEPDAASRVETTSAAPARQPPAEPVAATMPRSKSTVASFRELTKECGSYSYMAPEVLMGGKYDEKSDIFSMGMVMYALFARTIPAAAIVIQGGDNQDLLLYAWRVASQGYRPPLPESVPAPIVEAIKRCWSADPGDRPSAEALVGMLQRATDSGLIKGGGNSNKCCVVC